MTKSVAVVCFHSNRSCRLAPARHGMKSRNCGLARRIGRVDSATPDPDPSGGQAPALHSPLPTPLDSGLRRNDDPGDLGDSEAQSKRRRGIFVPIAHAGRGRHTKV